MDASQSQPLTLDVLNGIELNAGDAFLAMGAFLRAYYDGTSGEGDLATICADVEVQASAAHAIMDLEDHAATLDRQLDEQLGANYTGEWFDPTSERMKIGLTAGEGYERTVEQDLNNLGLADDTDIVPSSASSTQLASAKEELDTKLASLVSGGLVQVGIRAEGDAVSIKKAHSLTTAQANEVAKAVSELTVPSRVTGSSSASLKATLSGCTHGWCSRPLRGGVRLLSGSKGGYQECSAGFLAQSVYSKRLYVTTAGHCAYYGGHEGEEWKAPTPTEGSPKIGRSRAYVLGGHGSVAGPGDAALIELEPGGYWTPSVASLERLEVPPIIIQYQNTGAGLPRNERYRILDTAAPVEMKVESVVCVNGVGTPTEKEEKEGKTEAAVPQDACGEIENLTIGITSETPFELTELMELNMCIGGKGSHPIKEGTSGGPVVKLHRAVGMQSSIEEGGCADYVEPIGAAERFLHVRILTGFWGSNRPDRPETRNTTASRLLARARYVE